MILNLFGLFCEDWTSNMRRSCLWFHHRAWLLLFRWSGIFSKKSGKLINKTRSLNATFASAIQEREGSCCMLNLQEEGSYSLILHNRHNEQLYPIPLKSKARHAAFTKRIAIKLKPMPSGIQISRATDHVTPDVQNMQVWESTPLTQVSLWQMVILFPFL